MSRTFSRQLVALLAAGAGALMLSSLPANAKSPGYQPPHTAGAQLIKYPMDAQRMGEEGTVFIQVYVTDSGRPHNARLVRSSGVDRLDNAALESVLAWRFQPAQENGHTVSGWANVQVTYKVPAGQ